MDINTGQMLVAGMNPHDYFPEENASDGEELFKDDQDGGSGSSSSTSSRRTCSPIAPSTPSLPPNCLEEEKEMLFGCSKSFTGLKLFTRSTSNFWTLRFLSDSGNKRQDCPREEAFK